MGEVEKKIHSLKSQYSKEVSRVTKSDMFGAGPLSYVFVFLWFTLYLFCLHDMSVVNVGIIVSVGISTDQDLDSVFGQLTFHILPKWEHLQQNIMSF
jgi:hypothetical protein